MSVIQALKRTPKGQLPYERYLIPSKLNNDLDKYSSPPLSGPHKEREFSLLNPSFGLDPANFSNDSLSPSGDNVKRIFTTKNTEDNIKANTDTARSNINYSNNSIGNSSSSPPTYSPNEGNTTLSISQALAQLDLEIIEENDQSRNDPCHKSVTESTSPMENQRDGKVDNLSYSSSPLFTKYGLTSCAILEEEKLWKGLTKQAMYRRRLQFEEHEEAMKFLMKQKKNEASMKINNQIQCRNNLIEHSQQESKVRSDERRQKQKEGYEEHQKKIVTKHQEIERQREKLEEEEKKRQEQEAAKLLQLKSLFKEIEEGRNTFRKLREGFELKEKLSETIDKYQTSIDNIYTNLGQQLTECEKPQVISVDRINNFLSQKEQILHKVELLKQEMDSILKKVKENELREAEQKKIEAVKKEEEKKIAEKAMDFGIQSVAFVLKDKQAKDKLLADTSPVIQAFISNAQMKKFRFDLQRAVNTPINAISAVSGAHLRGKLQSLHILLKGQQVHVAGKQVSTAQSPEGMAFCQNLIAKMLVKKGEEQVTSNHESAFAIAAVAVGLWAEFPIVGDLFLAHLQAVCPYVLPFYNLRQDGQSTQDYYKSLGYKIDDDGAVEEQDKFLHRMSGVMRLYCACMVAIPVKGANSPHPHGVENAWMWLCRTMNMEPQADITAAMIFDMLSVTGHFLFMEYKIQFVKLLHLLYKTYLPKLKEVSITSSIVGRLEIFLENSLQNNAKIEPPKGILPSNFWLL